jgi:hypothetical protein
MPETEGVGLRGVEAAWRNALAMVIVDVQPALYLLIFLGLASTVFLSIISVSNVCGLNARTFPA